jgi:DNA-binding NtrC family response regulator
MSLNRKLEQRDEQAVGHHAQQQMALTRVAIITGDTSAEMLERARRRNNTLLLHKPVNPGQLRSLILHAKADERAESA